MRILESMCPCNECLCLPACKSKVFSHLIQCDIIYRFLEDSIPEIYGWDYDSRIIAVVKALKHPIIYDGLKNNNDYQKIFEVD